MKAAAGSTFKHRLLAWLASAMRLIPQLHHVWRKAYIYRVNLTATKLVNFLVLLWGFVMRVPDVRAVPLHIKVDITPHCQLRCPVCLHGEIDASDRKALPRAMGLNTFKALVDQVRGRCHVMSLYNLGEPLLNKDLEAMVSYACAANINTYITTNLSLPLNDARLRGLLDCGLTSLIVAIDGISEETFGRERRGGTWEMVRDNLKRVAEMARGQGPKIIVQYIYFEHNLHEVPLVRQFCRDLGVYQTLIIKGTDRPWTEQFAPRQGWHPKRAKATPRCAWPFFSAMIGADGGVYGCCYYRMREISNVALDGRPLGNVTTSPLGQIYAGEAYQAARRLAIDPARFGPQPDHFCHGCVFLQD